jgi:hypothetical protein
MDRQLIFTAYGNGGVLPLELRPPTEVRAR